MDKIIKEFSERYSGGEIDSLFAKCFEYCLEEGIEFTPELKKEVIERFVELHANNPDKHPSLKTNTNLNKVDLVKIKLSLPTHYYSSGVLDFFKEDIEGFFNGYKYLYYNLPDIMIFFNQKEDLILSLHEMNEELEEDSYGFSIYASDLTKKNLSTLKDFDNEEESRFSKEKLFSDLNERKLINYTIPDDKELVDEIIDFSKENSLDPVSFITSNFHPSSVENNTEIVKWIKEVHSKYLHLKLNAYKHSIKFDENSVMHKALKEFKEDCLKSVSKIKVDDLEALQVAIQDPDTPKDKCLSILKRLQRSQRLRPYMIIGCTQLDYLETVDNLGVSDFDVNVDLYLDYHSSWHKCDHIQSLNKADSGLIKRLNDREGETKSYFSSSSGLFVGFSEYLSSGREKEASDAIKKLGLTPKKYIREVLGKEGVCPRDVIDSKLPGEIKVDIFRDISCRDKMAAITLFEWFEFDRVDVLNSVREIAKNISNNDDYIRFVIKKGSDEDKEVVLDYLKTLRGEDHSIFTFSCLPSELKKQIAQESFENMTPGEFNKHRDMLVPHLPKQAQGKVLGKLVKTVSGAESVLKMDEVDEKIKLRALRKCAESATDPRLFLNGISGEILIDVTKRFFKKNNDLFRERAFIEHIDDSQIPLVLDFIPSKTILKSRLLGRASEIREDQIKRICAEAISSLGDLYDVYETLNRDFYIRYREVFLNSVGVSDDCLVSIFESRASSDEEFENVSVFLGGKLTNKAKKILKKKYKKVDKKLAQKLSRTRYSGDVYLLGRFRDGFSDDEIDNLIEIINGGRVELVELIPENRYCDIDPDIIGKHLVYSDRIGFSGSFDIEIYELAKRSGCQDKFIYNFFNTFGEISESDFEFLRNEHTSGFINSKNYVTCLGRVGGLERHIESAMVSLLRGFSDEDNETNITILSQYISSKGIEPLFHLVSTRGQLDKIIRLDDSLLGSRYQKNKLTVRYKAFKYFAESDIDVDDMFMSAYTYAVKNGIGEYEKTEAFLSDHPRLTAKNMSEIIHAAWCESKAELGRVLRALISIGGDIKGFRGRIFSKLSEINEYDWIKKIFRDGFGSEEILKEIECSDDEGLIVKLMRFLDNSFIEKNYQKFVDLSRQLGDNILRELLDLIENKDLAYKIIVDVASLGGNTCRFMISGKINNETTLYFLHDGRREYPFTYSYRDNKVIHAEEIPENILEAMKELVAPYIDLVNRSGVVDFAQGKFISDDLEISLDRGDLRIQCSLSDDDYYEIAREFNLDKKVNASLSVSTRGITVNIEAEEVVEDEVEFFSINENIKKDINDISLELDGILGELNGDKPFGIEIEYSSKITRQELARRISNETGLDVRGFNDYFSSNGENWDIKYDSSIEGMSAEMVSPKLYGEDGINELKKVLEAIEKINKEKLLLTGTEVGCGIHVHHDASDIIKASESIKKAFKRGLFKIQGALYEICNAKRSRSHFSRKMGIREVREANLPMEKNGFHFTRYGTLEFRMKEGTFDKESILRWVKITREVVDILRAEFFESANSNFNNIIDAITLERVIQYKKGTEGYGSLDDFKRSMSFTKNILKSA